MRFEITCRRCTRASRAGLGSTKPVATGELEQQAYGCIAPATGADGLAEPTDPVIYGKILGCQQRRMPHRCLKDSLLAAGRCRGTFCLFRCRCWVQVPRSLRRFRARQTDCLFARTLRAGALPHFWHARRGDGGGGPRGLALRGVGQPRRNLKRRRLTLQGRALPRGRGCGGERGFPSRRCVLPAPLWLSRTL